jgi:hypothetical protein
MSSHDPERDARLFLNDVYGGQPDGTVIAVGPVKRPHYVYGPEDALSYIVNKIDRYCRVTLLGGRPKSGRGAAEDSVALPGLVADFDLNGAPDGRGGVVTGAFDSVEDALDCAHRFLAPTVTVRSGYGVQPWWLFERMEPLSTQEDRERVHLLARQWEQAHRTAAGVTKLDQVADLARVMRAPGSLNGKGSEPVPVVLLDDGGPRYTLEQFAELLPVKDEPMPTPMPMPNAGVEPTLDVVLGLLDRHPDLAKLVSHEDKAPGDGSPSARDFALACRACEHGYDDTEVAAVIAYHRSRHPDPKAKGERPDYIERTVRAAREKIGAAPRDRTLEQARNKLADLLQLERAPEAPFVVQATAIYGHGATARGVVFLSRGQTLEFDRVGDIGKQTRLAEELAASIGVATNFTKTQAITALALVRQIAEGSAALAELAATRSMANLILTHARVVKFDYAKPASRYSAWHLVQGHDPLEDLKAHDPASFATKMIVLRDGLTGATYVRAAWAQEVIRRELGAGYSTARVQGLLLRAGWTQPTADGSIEATQVGRQRIRLWFYVVPNGWGES